ncbi:MAG: AAA family ATPase, partial [Pseudomonadota bacterium]
MYEQFFGFECRPFTLRPDPRFLYRGETHTTALRMLEYGLFEQDGFVVLTGEVGSGKTMLVRHLLNTLDDNFQIGLIANTHASFGDLLTWVLRRWRTNIVLPDPTSPVSTTNPSCSNSPYSSMRSAVVCVSPRYRKRGSGQTLLVRHLLNTLDDNFQIGLIA